jgi:hypothetical protein
VSFERCRASAHDVLEGPGLRFLEIAMNASRILIASTALGISGRVRDLSMKYAKRKRLVGSLLINNAVFAVKLGQMEMDIEAMKHLCRGAAREFDAIITRSDAAKVFLRKGTLKPASRRSCFCGRPAGGSPASDRRCSAGSGTPVRPSWTRSSEMSGTCRSSRVAMMYCATRCTTVMSCRPENRV